MFLSAAAVFILSLNCLDEISTCIHILFNCSVSQSIALANISLVCCAVYCHALHSLNAPANQTKSVDITDASPLRNHIGISKSCIHAAAFKYSFCDNHIAVAVSCATFFTSQI